MATARQQNIFDMFEATLVFNTENKTDYTDILDAAKNFGTVTDTVAALEGFFAKQLSGQKAAATELKSVLRLAIRRKMVAYAKNARAIALNNPGFDEFFKVPDENNDTILIASGREFVTGATENAELFSALGKLPADAIALTEDLDAFEAADVEQDGGKQETVGATAGIEAAIDGGMRAEKVLDAIMNNVYINNAVKLAQWKTARHVKRTNQTPTPPTPPITE